ncbi:MAG: Bpu10I family restriction endonuclease [Lachnospiraceae bacterium]|nr:Bpu10I family restriction endonuclease [Lachnospiraceae bacterium]
MHVHENNIETKISSNYNGCEKELKSFRDKVYLPMRNRIESLDLTKGRKIFDEVAEILNDYWTKLHKFATDYKIKSQSKFESTFLEEISFYLFHNLNEIKDGRLAIFNKGIYAGLKINEDLSIDVIKKDVDFCIGKKINISIDEQKPVSLIIPAVSVEVKTYLDATMFGEIKSSSKTLKSSTPNSCAYVLMGYKNIADEHILAARQDATLDEMFVLQASEGAPIDSDTLYEYYREIKTAISSLATPPTITVPGRLLQYAEMISKTKI